MNSPSSHTCALPTGGFSLPLFCSIQPWRLKAFNVEIDGIVLSLGNWLKRHCPDLDQQMRMRQLMDGDGGARRTVVVEKLAVDFVVSGEVVHVNEVGGHLHHVAKRRAFAGEY